VSGGLLFRAARKSATAFESFLLSRSLVLTHTPKPYTRPRLFDISEKAWDYARYSALEMVAARIKEKGIKGNVAEVGVYKGTFASRINMAFPDRKLYLFDTFEGFDSRDVVTEKQNGFSTGEQDFSDTNAKAVLRSMPFPKKCELRIGFFPGTAEGLDDQFAFVSLDPDLHDPAYEGLKYFYPRLSPGGYIFVHDYNVDDYSGINVAVDTFCQENNLSLFPLSDKRGSIVITKQ